METLRFEELGICPEIQKAVKHMGFEEASPIQSKAIPVMMTGKDIIGQAQTGTGKTAAFGIPMLEKIDPKNKKLQGIVLCPTRELANSGGGGNPESGKVYAWNQSTSNLWRAGNCKTDSFLEEWNTADHRNTGTCDGPHEKKDN